MDDSHVSIGAVARASDAPIVSQAQSALILGLIGVVIRHRVDWFRLGSATRLVDARPDGARV